MGEYNHVCEAGRCFNYDAPGCRDGRTQQVPLVKKIAAAALLMGIRLRRETRTEETHGHITIRGGVPHPVCEIHLYERDALPNALRKFPIARKEIPLNFKETIEAIKT